MKWETLIITKHIANKLTIFYYNYSQFFIIIFNECYLLPSNIPTLYNKLMKSDFPKIKILINGYVTEKINGFRASCTVTLIQTKNQNIIVDPGINKKLLLNRLKKENLKTKDIDIVFFDSLPY